MTTRRRNGPAQYTRTYCALLWPFVGRCRGCGRTTILTTQEQTYWATRLQTQGELCGDCAAKRQQPARVAKPTNAGKPARPKRRSGEAG